MNLRVILAAMIVLGAAGRALPEPPVLEGPLRRAEMIARIPRFIIWPDQAFRSTQAPFVFGFIGRDPIVDILKAQLRSTTVRGRRVEFRRVTLAEVSECHCLYVGASEEPKLPRILESLRGRSVLLISGIERFAEVGGVVRVFEVPEMNRAVFEINQGELNRRGLRAEARLLSIAWVILEEGP
jgi:hypothetical protein